MISEQIHSFVALMLMLNIKNAKSVKTDTSIDIQSRLISYVWAWLGFCLNSFINRFFSFKLLKWSCKSPHAYYRLNFREKVFSKKYSLNLFRELFPVPGNCSLFCRTHFFRKRTFACDRLKIDLPMLVKFYLIFFIALSLSLQSLCREELCLNLKCSLSFEKYIFKWYINKEFSGNTITL